MKKILIVAPFGMTLRQIIINDTFWKYLKNNFEVHIETTVEVPNYTDLGITKIFSYRPKNILVRIGLKICNYFFFIFKNYGDIEFLIKNNLGEHFVHRMSRESKKDDLLKSYALLSFLKPIENFLYDLFVFFCKKITRINRDNYSFLLVTHISEFRSNIEAISANSIKTPVITYTLGMDNYRHGKILFKPNLMLLWGRDHEYEFLGWHKEKYNDMKSVNHEIVGNLAHDFFVQNVNEKVVKDYIFKKKKRCYKGYIVVPAMLESVIPGQTVIVEKIISYLKVKNLDILIIVRVMPASEIEMWLNFENKHKEHILIQEPIGSSFDKRGIKSKFNINQEKFDSSFFASLLAGAELILSIYPSTVTIDGFLFGTPSILPLFSWQDLNTINEHPYAKIVLAKILTHPLNKQYNIVKNVGELHEVLDDILIDKNRETYVGNELYEYVCDQSKDGRVGHRAAEAIDKFLHQ